MESYEKLTLLEEILRLPIGSLTEETPLEDVDGWEDLQILEDLQAKLTMRGIQLTIEEIKEFERVSELCRLIK